VIYVDVNIFPTKSSRTAVTDRLKTVPSMIGNEQPWERVSRFFNTFYNVNGREKIPIPIPRYFKIPTPIPIPTFKNTDKNTEYRAKIPIPTQLYFT